MVTRKNYYGNSGKVLGSVEKLPYKTWKELVESAFSVCYTLNVTRTEFENLSHKNKQVRKRVSYLCPCSFEGLQSPRKIEFAKKVQILFLDIDIHTDKNTNQESFPAKPFVNYPNKLKGMLGDFNFVAHTTATSKPDRPKMRIAVDCAGFDIKHYEKAVLYISHLIGLPIQQYAFFKESKNPVQPMFRPTQFKGDDPALEHPVLCKEVNGRGLKLSDFENFKPSDSFADKTKVTSFKDVSGDALEFLRPPLEEIDKEEVEKALSHISPDIGYTNWLMVAAALRHQFPNKDADTGYDIFHTWSMQGDKYQGEEDCRAKWSSLKWTPKNRAPVTIRSLLHLAQESGYETDTLKEKCINSTTDFLESCVTFAELCSKGLGKIATTPLLSQTEEEAFLNDLIKIAKDRHSKKVSITSLKKDYRRLKAKLKPKDEEEKSQLPFWANGIVFVSKLDKFYRHTSQEWFTPASLNRTLGKYLLPEEEELRMQGLEDNMAARTRPVVEPSQFLLNEADIPVVHDMLYNPQKPEETFIEFEDKRYINTYGMTHPEPKKENSAKAGNMLLAHLRNIIVEEEYVQILMDYLCYIVQYTGHKVHWLPVIQGAEGGGKSAIMSIMQAVLGSGNTRIVGVSDIFSGYNEWSISAQLIGLEEIRVEGKGAGVVKDILKPLITNPIVPINEKYQIQRDAPSFSNFIAFSNHQVMVKLEPTDRRHFIIKSRQQTYESIPDENYFDELFKLKNEYAGSLRYFMETYKIRSSFRPKGRAPRTKYFYEVLGDSKSDLEVEVMQILNDNDFALIKKDLISITALVTYLQVNSESQKYVTAQKIGSVLRNMGYKRLTRIMLKGNERHVFWVKNHSAIKTDSDVKFIAKGRIETCEDEEDGIA